MDWNMVSAISTAFMALVILCTAIVAKIQLKEIRRSRQLDAFTNFILFLQREDIREARCVLIEDLSKKDFKNWSKDEIRKAEKACHTYNTAGIIDAKNFIEKDFIAQKNRYSIIKCWEAAKPMIEKYRAERGEDFWYDFEGLYKKAKQIGEKHRKV